MMMKTLFLSSALATASMVALTAAGPASAAAQPAGFTVQADILLQSAFPADGPGAAVSWAKQRRIARLAQVYMKWLGLRDARCRFDVVEVTVHDAAMNVRPVLRTVWSTQHFDCL